MSVDQVAEEIALPCGCRKRGVTHLLSLYCHGCWDSFAYRWAAHDLAVARRAELLKAQAAAGLLPLVPASLARRAVPS